MSTSTHPVRLGKYRLSRRIAVGGTAEVFLAMGEGLSGFKKEVVIKRLIPEHARDPHLLAMFLDEARLMALFHHPHLVEVYDIGEQEGAYYFAMEHLPGRDLRDVLAAAAQPLPLATAVGIVSAVARGLAYAHETRDQAGRLLGVVHRDVSPSNVLLGWDGRVKLVDFGIAKWAAQRSRTEQGTLKGKFAYMSPEQCRGEPLDRRSDVFALGVLLYELATGVRPFAKDGDFEVLSAIVRGEVQPPSAVRPELARGLGQVILRALAVAPADRFATAADLAEALCPFADPPSELGAGVAALLAARFPAEGTSPGPVLADGPSGPVGVAATAAPPMRPPSGGERTATDAAALSARPMPRAERGLSRPAPRPRRWALGLAAAALALSLGVTWMLRSGPAERDVPASLSRKPARGAAALLPRARAQTAVAPAQPVLPADSAVEEPKAPRPRAAVGPAAGARRRGRRDSKTSQAVRLWHPDSPVPPAP